MSQEKAEYRRAISTDAVAIANLHADSWRQHYRGAYSDGFLDDDVLADRLAVWTDRTHAEHTDGYTIVAEAGKEIIAFAHIILGHDGDWGALVENLHVAGFHHRRGVGTELMARLALVVLERAPPVCLYLWVLEQNTTAQSFYRALGGTYVQRAPAPAPGGDSRRLAGSPWRLRFVWPDPKILLDKAQALKAVGLEE
jgi:ribosomal protein S18 acetylase RimI-like enzyme